MTHDRVLYVGVDDRAARRSLRALRRAGFVATRVRSRSEAITTCQVASPAVVVIDLRGVRKVRYTVEQLSGSGAVVVVIAPARRGRLALEHGAWDYLDPRDAAYVRDLAPTVVRAIAYARLRGECVRAREETTEPLPRPVAAQSLADAVIAAMAQEIKTPLLALCGYGQLLAQPGIFDEAVAVHAARLDRGAQAVTAMVDDLIAALRTQSTRDADTRAATDLNELVSSAVHRADERARMERKHIEFQRAKLLPIIALDRLRLARLLDGLLSLALAGVPRGGVVRVATGVQHRRVILRVSSRIALASQHGRSVNHAESTALSALARVIVGAHGGEVTLQGPPGAAVGVTMRLPIRETRWAVGQ